MIQQIAVLSLMITGLRVATWSGNMLMHPRVWCANLLDKILGKKWSRYVQKPLWDCLPCMASVWTIVFTWSIDIKLILAVCGMNVLIDVVLNKTGYGPAD